MSEYIEDLKPRRDAREFWDCPGMKSKCDDPFSNHKITGHMEKRGISQDYFKGSSHIKKFIGPDKNKNGLDDRFEKKSRSLFSKLGGKKNVRKFI